MKKVIFYHVCSILYSRLKYRKSKDVSLKKIFLYLVCKIRLNMSAVLMTPKKWLKSVKKKKLKCIRGVLKPKTWTNFLQTWYHFFRLINLQINHIKSYFLLILFMSKQRKSVQNWGLASTTILCLKISNIVL